VSFDILKPESFIEYSNQLMILYHRADARHLQPPMSVLFNQVACEAADSHSVIVQAVTAARHLAARQPQCFSMRSSLHLLILLAVAAGLSACARAARISTAIHNSWIAAGTLAPQSSERTRNSIAKPRYAAHTATLDVTFGLQVAGVAALPRDFVPDMSRAPLWLHNGAEVGIIGTRAGKGVMLGFSGVNLSRQRIVVEDYGAGAPGGRLLDVAISPDGHTVATAIAAAARSRLEVNLADASRPAEMRPAASLEGEFNSAQLSWLSSAKITLAAQAATSAADELTAKTVAVPVGGLYLITLGAHTSTRRLDGVKCQLSPLAFSPNNAFAVAQGGSGAPPAIVNVHGGTCTGFPSGGPLQVLGWAPHSAAFLYRTADQDGVFRFDLLTGRTSTIAISSGAAAYASDGTIIALGSQKLSWRGAAAQPISQVKAQIALFDPYQNLTTINSLGFATQPALLAQSTMVFSRVSNDAIIDTAIPEATGLVREIIEYSYPARAAFVLAHGPVQGPVAISWSPNGKLIALVDGNAIRRTLAVIAPPK